MKYLFAAFLLCVSATHAFADQLCFKNDGIYIARVKFRLYKKNGSSYLADYKDIVYKGDSYCMTDGYNPSEKESVTVRVEHDVGFGNYVFTCDYPFYSGNHIVVSNGTTFDFWCHTSRI